MKRAIVIGCPGAGKVLFKKTISKDGFALALP